ncbi:hypothetical protein CEXT_670181 [Caerostris extrusa]|uniref:Ycf15 n=1 Tax=Caerostris extrusa TaxID=172846 RepID=A0AAV4WHE4_CAEEX|nr:hypothetical protein CEXT_670181 [Caerostris extrusa]
MVFYNRNPFIDLSRRCKQSESRRINPPPSISMRIAEGNNVAGSVLTPWNLCFLHKESLIRDRSLFREKQMSFLVRGGRDIFPISGESVVAIYYRDTPPVHSNTSPPACYHEEHRWDLRHFK